MIDSASPRRGAWASACVQRVPHERRVRARWTGDWDWALGELEEMLAGDLERETRISALTMTIQIRALRGDPVAELLPRPNAWPATPWTARS